MDRFQYSREFDEKFAYEGKDLGALCTPQGTNFRLWAPFADKVELCLYEDGDREAIISRILDMEKVIPGDVRLTLPEANVLVVGQDEIICDFTMATLKSIGLRATYARSVKEAVLLPEKEEGYQELFRTFHRTIGIKSRENKKLQRQMCAYRYQDYMVEFAQKG